MDKDHILRETEDYIKREMLHESSGHDYTHVKHVERNAINIQKIEGGDLFIIRMAALLHDIGDMKLHNGDTTAARRIVGEWLKKISVDDEEAEHILYIIDNMSFYKSLVNPNPEKSKEFKIVQDADWLEALGSIGIARALHYGGARARKIYDPNTPLTPLTAERYKKEGGSKDSVTHLYEKGLMLLKMLNTDTAKKIGREREKMIESYLHQFQKEWNGKDFEELS